MTPKKDKETRRMRGFERAAGLVQRQIRGASEARGFAESRLLTHWAEIAGDEVAASSRPVKVSYSAGGFGATLTLLTTGAQAPMLQASLPQIQARVNACYGYAAISRIRVTQTAPQGFADGRVEFTPKSTKPRTPEPTEDIRRQAHAATEGVADRDLAAALERLGQNILSNAKS